MAKSDLLSLRAIRAWIRKDGLEGTRLAEDHLGSCWTGISQSGNGLEVKAVVKSKKKKAIFQGMKAI